MTLTVGILTYNRDSDIIDTANFVLSSRINGLELIIVDNNEVSSKNNILPQLNLYNGMEVKYIHDGINHGVSEGRNIIAKNSKNEIIIFLDDDVIIEDFKEISEKVIFEFSKRQIGILAFNIIDNKTKINNKFEFPHKNKKLIGTGSFYTYYFVGAGHAIRKSLFESLGGYGKELGLYGMEEVDFSYRAINLGFYIKFCEDIIVYHKRSPDGRITNQQALFNAFSNKSRIASQGLNFYYAISHNIIWAIFYLFKTRDIKSIYSVWVSNVKVILSRNEKFGDGFYKYCKNVKAWLWW